MNLYDMLMSPLEALLLREIRAEIIPSAYGDVLEAGIGTGANGRFYNYDRISSLTGLDREISSELWKPHHKEKFVFALGDVAHIPFKAERFDCVVATLVLCTADCEKSLHEITRVLKPGGRYMFIEHVRPKGMIGGRLCDACNGAWTRFARGCNLNRRTDAMLYRAGFADIRMKQRCGGVFIYGAAVKS